MSSIKNVCLFDIEADNLLYGATTIWCIVAKLDGQYLVYLQKEGFTLPTNTKVWYDVDQYMQEVLTPNTLCGHNIISYDLPLLKKLHNFEYKINPNKLIDTHILSRLYNPDRLGHSLEFFGELLKFPKGDHSDWTQLSQEMVDYCIRDVDLTEAVYKYLAEEGNDWDWSEAIKLEYNIWHIQAKQELHGVLFDVPKAEQTLQAIQQEIQELESSIINQTPLSAKDEGELKKIFLKSGEYTTPVKQWLEFAYGVTYAND